MPRVERERNRISQTESDGEEMTPTEERIEKLKTFIGLAREVHAHAMGMQAICPDRSVAALIGCVAELERHASCELQELFPPGPAVNFDYDGERIV